MHLDYDQDETFTVQWVTFPTYNHDYEYADDNLEIEIRVYENDTGIHAEPLKYCYNLDDGNGPREYGPSDHDAPFSWPVIERHTRRFFKDNSYHLLTSA